MEYKPVVRDGNPAEAVVIRCIDPDFQVQFDTVQSELVKGKYDPLAVAGPDFSIVNEEYPLQQIRLAHQLHKISRVIILPHINCKRIDISDESAELKRHQELLDQGRDKITEEFPDIQVEGYVLGWDSVIYSMKD